MQGYDNSSFKRSRNTHGPFSIINFGWVILSHLKAKPVCRSTLKPAIAASKQRIPPNLEMASLSPTITCSVSSQYTLHFLLNSIKATDRRMVLEGDVFLYDRVPLSPLSKDVRLYRWGSNVGTDSHDLSTASPQSSRPRGYHEEG